MKTLGALGVTLIALLNLAWWGFVVWAIYTVVQAVAN